MASSLKPPVKLHSSGLFLISRTTSSTESTPLTLACVEPHMVIGGRVRLTSQAEVAGFGEGGYGELLKAGGDEVERAVAAFEAAVDEYGLGWKAARR